MKRKMKGKIFAILVSLAMVFTMIPIMGTSVYADDPHANFTPKYLAKITLGRFESIWATQFYPPVSSFYDHETGETVMVNPAELKEVNGVIEISHPGQLVRLAGSVNSGTDYTGKTIKLISDISLQTPFDTEIAPTILEDTSDPITHGDFGITLSNRGYCKWPSPIGSNEHPFKGTFDGQGHKITQMGVFNDGENDLLSGLFGVTENAVIKNLNITGHFVLAKATGENQNSYAGALAGKCKNTRIENVHASCNIFNHALKGDAYSGGLVGYMADNSTAINSSSSGDIYNTCGEGSDSTAGGLFGRAADFDSTRKILAANCFASGNVYASSGRKIDAFVLAGGLVGTTGLCRINNCYATGNVSAYHTDSSTGSCTQGPAAGGLVGNNNCDINNSYATGNVYSGTKTEGRASCCAGGLSGYIQNGTFTNCYTTIANDPESGRVIEVKTRGKENQVKNFDYSNWGIQERAKSDFSDGTVASLLNGEGGNVWTTENGKTVLRDNPGYSTPQDAWGTKITENGATYYVADDGKTSAMVKAGEIVWLKEESGGTNAWYGLDNSENAFEEGSRFWVKRITKEEDPVEWESYYGKLDEKNKEQAEKSKVGLLLCGVIRPNHEAYEHTDAPVRLYVERGDEWKQEEITGVYIRDGADEIVEVGSAERIGGPERAGTYAVLKLTHFGTYAMIGKASTKPEHIPVAPKVSGTPTAKVTTTKKSMTLGWNKIEGADGYDIFFAECNHNKKNIVCKNVKTIEGNNIFTWKKSGLKKGTAYKSYVKAYIIENGQKKYVNTSPTMHAYTGKGNKKYTNAKSVTIKNVKKGKLSLANGKTFKIKAKVNKMQKGKKLMPNSHAPKLRYLTSDSNVATVNSKGKITAKGSGTCTIYVFAHNGVSKQIKVTVR